jgi:hypothetical protein
MRLQTKMAADTPAARKNPFFSEFRCGQTNSKLNRRGTFRLEKPQKAI